MSLRQVVPTSMDDVDPWDRYDVERVAPVGRPFVIVNMVSSVDGATMVDGATAPLSSPADQAIFGILRVAADVILVGAQTVRAEDYGPPKISDRGRQRRVARGQAPQPRIAVVTRSLDLNWHSRLFQDPEHRPLVLAPVDAPAAALTSAAAVADVVTAGQGDVDLTAALEAVGDRGMSIVLCEGGPVLNSHLAEAHLIDELCLTLSPLLAGDDSARLLATAHVGGVAGLDLQHVLEEEGFLFLRYAARQWPDLPSRPVASAEQAVARAEASLDEIAGDLEYPMLVVTAAAEGDQQGCLVGFASQCSIDPLRYMVWISKRNRTAMVVRGATHLGVHFLSSDNMDLAKLFGEHSGDEIDKFRLCRWHAGPHDTPILDDCARWFVGEVISRDDTGDHLAVLVEPVETQTHPWSGQLGFQMTHDLRAAHEA